MNQLVAQSRAGEVLVVLPIDFPPGSVTVQMIDADGEEAWSPEHSVTPPTYALAAAPAIGDRTITVASYGSRRVPQSGDELFLAKASSPAQYPRETIVVRKVEGTTLHLAEPLKRAWSISDLAHPKHVRVPLSADDTATLGRNYQVYATIVFTGLPDNEATREVPALFDVVANVPANTVTWAYLQARNPTLFSALGGEQEEEQGGFESRLEAAYRDALAEIHKVVKVDKIVSASDLEPITIAKLRWQLAEEDRLPRRGDAYLDTVRYYREEFQATLKSTLQRLTAVDKNADKKLGTNETDVNAGERHSFRP